MDTKEETKTTSKEQTTAAAPQVKLVDAEPIKAAVEGIPVPTAGPTSKARANKYTVITVICVAVALLVVLYQLERQERIGTNVFGPMISALEGNVAAAVVNGEKIKNADLESTLQQLSQTALQRGFDTSDPEVQDQIRSQAIDMTVNTVLLEQAAVANDVEVSDEEIAARVQELAESAGGEEALMERLAEFDIDEEQLYTDVRDELVIRELLEEVVFTETDVTVSADEIAQVYDDAVANSGGQELPPLEQVSAQIEQQLRQGKEQEALEAYLQQLRADADITLN